MNSGRWWLWKRGNQYKIILTLEMIGNLHTLLHSQATYIHHVHREDGYGDAPRGTNWKKKHRHQENDFVAKNHPSRHKRQEKPTGSKVGREGICSFLVSWNLLMMFGNLKTRIYGDGEGGVNRRKIWELWWRKEETGSGTATGIFYV